MLKENLKRANELEKLIEECEQNIKLWENVYEITDKQIRSNFKGSISGGLALDGVPINVLKALSLDYYNRELRTLELEFSNLK